MIKIEKEYQTIVERVETLLQISDNIENRESEGYVELNLLSDLMAEYEKRTNIKSSERNERQTRN